MHLWIRTTTLLVVAAALLLLPTTPARAADPTTGDCISASEKSLALRNDHKLRAARAQLLVCASTNCPADIRKECARRVDEVNAAVPTIVFGAKDPTGNDLTAVKVTMDGDTITERLEGTAISIDPGAHVFTFQAAGQPLLTKEIVVREGEKERREVLQIGVRLVAPPAATVIVPVPGPGPVAPPPPPPRPLGTQRVAALAVGAVGVVGLGVGAAFGGLAVSKHTQAVAACPGTGCLTQNGVDLWNATHLDGNISTAALIVGGVALAGGVVLFVTAKPKPVQVGLGPGSVMLKGEW
jgi:hypothetical protein